MNIGLVSRTQPWLCFLLGALCLYAGSQGLGLAKRTAGWERTPGQILSASVEHHALPKGGARYFPFIMYEFRIDSSVLRASRLSFARQDFRTWADAEAVVASYPVGRSVTVYYNPLEPTESVLEPIGPWEPYWVMGMGGVLLLLGVGLAVMLSPGIRKKRQVN